jgi:hypothetical protein
MRLTGVYGSERYEERKAKRDQVVGEIRKRYETEARKDEAEKETVMCMWWEYREPWRTRSEGVPFGGGGGGG